MDKASETRLELDDHAAPLHVVIPVFDTAGSETQIPNTEYRNPNTETRIPKPEHRILNPETSGPGPQPEIQKCEP